MLSFDFFQNFVDHVAPIVKIDAGGDEADFFDHID